MLKESTAWWKTQIPEEYTFNSGICNHPKHLMSIYLINPTPCTLHICEPSNPSHQPSSTCYTKVLHIASGVGAWQSVLGSHFSKFYLLATTGASYSLRFHSLIPKCFRASVGSGLNTKLTTGLSPLVFHNEHLYYNY